MRKTTHLRSSWSLSQSVKTRPPTEIPKAVGHFVVKQAIVHVPDTGSLSVSQVVEERSKRHSNPSKCGLNFGKLAISFNARWVGLVAKQFCSAPPPPPKKNRTDPGCNFVLTNFPKAKHLTVATTAKTPAEVVLDCLCGPGDCACRAAAITTWLKPKPRAGELGSSWLGE